MRALHRVVRAGVRRRRVQTVVIALVSLMAVTTSILGGSLLVASSAPFDDAFARQQGAHLSAQFDASKTTTADLSASAAADGVTATAGPFETLSITPTVDMRLPDGSSRPVKLPPTTVAGRAESSSGIDQVDLVEGRWAETENEIVLAADGLHASVGETVELEDVPGSPEVIVVGIARSVTRTADAWVSPDAIESLTAPDAESGFQMLYRFDAAATKGDVADGRAVVEATVGEDALTGSQSWLAIRDDVNQETAVYVPFLIAFGVLGVVMSVLIVGNVIAGAVSSGSRRIGIMKALGFAPAQVVRAYMAQALIPAAIGAGIGVLAGNLFAQPVLTQTESAYKTTGLTVAWWVNLVVVAAVLGVVATTAWVSARRAGLLRTVDALAVGRTPSAGRGLRMARLTSRLPVPRSISLGLARPFARPARAGTMVAAVVFGAAAVTFAVGLSSSLGKVLETTSHEAEDVTVRTVSGPPDGGEGGEGGVRPAPSGAQERKAPGAAVDADAIASAISSHPDTAAQFATSSVEGTIAGLSGPAEVVAFDGDGSWGGYEMVSGRWFSAPGEAVAPSRFLNVTGTAIGDTVTLNVNGTTETVRIVGEVFETTDGMRLYTDAATLESAAPDLQPRAFHIAVKDGVDVGSYITALNKELEQLDVFAEPGGTDQESTVIDTLNALAAMLTLMLVTVSALGVLNSVVLDTRERVQELGVYKALGMMPRQTIAMVITSVVVPGLLGALIGAPLGLALHERVLPAMGRSAGLTLPDVVMDVYGFVAVLTLVGAGVLVAIVGSLLPAGWAAKTRTATALRTE